MVFIKGEQEVTRPTQDIINIIIDKTETRFLCFQGDNSCLKALLLHVQCNWRCMRVL